MERRQPMAMAIDRRDRAAKTLARGDDDHAGGVRLRQVMTQL